MAVKMKSSLGPEANKFTALGDLGKLPGELRNMIYFIIAANVNATTVHFWPEMIITTSWKFCGEAGTRPDHRRASPPKDPIALARTSKQIHGEMQPAILERAFTFDIDHDVMSMWGGKTHSDGFPMFQHLNPKHLKRITFSNVRFQACCNRLGNDIYVEILKGLLNLCESERVRGLRTVPEIQLIDEKGNASILNTMSPATKKPKPKRKGRKRLCLGLSSKHGYGAYDGMIRHDCRAAGRWDRAGVLMT